MTGGMWLESRPSGAEEGSGSDRLSPPQRRLLSLHLEAVPCTVPACNWILSIPSRKKTRRGRSGAFKCPGPRPSSSPPSPSAQ